MKPTLTRRGHPPGPINFNGPTGLTWRHAYRLVFNPLEFLQQVASTYGDIAFFRIFGKRGYFLNHPELIAQVLVHEAKSFEKLPRQLNVIRQIFGNGILVSKGQRWQLDRQHLQSAFGPDLMKRNAEKSISTTLKMITRWQQDSQRNRPVELVREMTRLTAEVTSAVLVDEDDPNIVESLTDAILSLSDEFSHEMNSLVRLPDWLPLRRKTLKCKSINFYRQFFDDLIASRKNSPKKNDLIGFLLNSPSPRGADSSYARDQLLTILIAGYHATSMALVWIFHALERHPEVETRIIQELNRLALGQPNGQRVPQPLAYLQSVIEECLRLYPPAWALFARQSIKPVEMRGYSIASGGWFYISPFVTHRSEQFFPDALRFDPQRFSPERRKEIPVYAYFPFGLGGHSCIGSRMAKDQMVLITATILSHFRLRQQRFQADPAMDARLVLRPHKKVWCRLHLRRNGSNVVKHVTDALYAENEN